MLCALQNAVCDVFSSTSDCVFLPATRRRGSRLKHGSFNGSSNSGGGSVSSSSSSSSSSGARRTFLRHSCAGRDHRLESRAPLARFNYVKLNVTLTAGSARFRLSLICPSLSLLLYSPCLVAFNFPLHRRNRKSRVMQARAAATPQKPARSF